MGVQAGQESEPVEVAWEVREPEAWVQQVVWEVRGPELRVELPAARRVPRRKAQLLRPALSLFNRSNRQLHCRGLWESDPHPKETA